MTDLRLADLVTIVLWLGLVASTALFVMLLIVLWPQVRFFFSGMTWRLLPALRTWAAENRVRAVKHYASDMSSGAAWEEDEEEEFDVAATTATTQQQRIAMPATDDNALLFQQQAATAAKFVKAGVCGETKALQIAFGVRPSSTNPRYAAARAALKAELEDETPIAQRPTSAKFAPR